MSRLICIEKPDFPYTSAQLHAVSSTSAPKSCAIEAGYAIDATGSTERGHTRRQVGQLVQLGVSPPNWGEFGGDWGELWRESSSQCGGIRLIGGSRRAVRCNDSRVPGPGWVRSCGGLKKIRAIGTQPALRGIEQCLCLLDALTHGRRLDQIAGIVVEIALLAQRVEDHPDCRRHA